MKKKQRILVCALLTLVLLVGVLPIGALAMAVPPTPEETVLVGGVALNLGQYVMNGETTAVTGEPAADASGFAYYNSGGMLFLVDYEYEGTGFTHDTTEKSVIYSAGILRVILFGNNSIKNTADKSIWGANGIRAKGDLSIDGPGALTIDAPYAIYGDALVDFVYGKTVIRNATLAIEAGGDFIVSGGFVELHSTQPILSAANKINGGALIATAEQGVFKTAPAINVDTEDEYLLYTCTDVAGNNQVAYLPANITQYKYFAVTPPTPTEIDSISVSGVTIPALGGLPTDADYEDATYGGHYLVSDVYVESFVGGAWGTAEESASIVAGVQYRVVLWIAPEDGYSFAADIGDGDVTLNGNAASVYNVNEYPFYNAVEIAYEFSYPAAPVGSITSITVSGLDLPAVGETADDMEFNPTTLVYGGAYQVIGRGLKKYTGTEWVAYNEAGDVIQASVRYRLELTLQPTGTDAFSDSLASANVTLNGKSGELLGFVNAGTAKYAQVALEFSYEPAPTDYGITIAKKNGTETIGVLITEENCTDVLGDGTVSYDPTTNTLTLNGYVYEGEGVYFEEQGAFFCLMADVPNEGLTIVLVGDNNISVSGSGSAGMIFFEGEGDDLTIKGNGSLSINAVMYGIALQADNGRLTIEGGVIDIIITGTMSVGIQAADFVMMDADLKITTAMLGIAAYSEDGICINGGSLEIDTTMGGYAFVYVDFEHMSFNPIKPDLSGYVGAYKMTAGVNQDGSNAADFDEVYLNSYKYVKLEPKHEHSYGSEWKSDSGSHWNECACGGKGNVAAHTDGDANGSCDTCGFTLTAVNTPGSTTTEEEKGLPAGAIVGIVIGAVVLLGGGGFALYWFVFKKKAA